MTSWEFLLQKKGDTSWLPLDSPTLEILEGAYRLASRSSFVNDIVDIHLRYFPDSDSGYKPLQNQTSKQVNPSGLLLIMPYTNFTPGIWQVNCRHAETWKKMLQFEVSPVMVEDMTTDWQDLAESEPDVKILPKQLIKLEQVQYLVTGKQDIAIAGEAYTSGELEITLKNPQSLATLVTTKHLLPPIDQNSDRLSFSHIITVPPQSESQVAIGEVRLHPSLSLNLEEYVAQQSIMVTCQCEIKPQVSTEIIEPIPVIRNEPRAMEAKDTEENEITVETDVARRGFPLLPFEAMPPNAIPIKRNIKLPELPKFLGFGKKARNLPPSNKNLNPHSYNYYELEDDLHYEFEEESTTIKPASGVIHLAKYRSSQFSNTLLKDPEQVSKTASGYKTEQVKFDQAKFEEVDTSLQRELEEILSNQQQDAAETDTASNSHGLPLPIIEIPDGGLIAGKAITISVKLPSRLDSKLCVKLWVKDYQTRAVIDGPRWLMDFDSHPLGLRESKTHITLPLGTQEVVFEAVSIEISTQRESHKTSITRLVNSINPLPNNNIDFSAVWNP